MASTVSNGNDRLRKGNKLRRHTWVEFVGSLLCSERFFSSHSNFLSPLNPSLISVYLS